MLRAADELVALEVSTEVLIVDRAPFRFCSELNDQKVDPGLQVRRRVLEGGVALIVGFGLRRRIGHARVGGGGWARSSSLRPQRPHSPVAFLRAGQVGGVSGQKSNVTQMKATIK